MAFFPINSKYNLLRGRKFYIMPDKKYIRVFVFNHVSVKIWLIFIATLYYVKSYNLFLKVVPELKKCFVLLRHLNFQSYTHLHTYMRTKKLNLKMIAVAVFKLTSFCIHEGVIFNSRTHFSGFEKKLFCLNVTLALRLYCILLCLHTSLRFNCRVFYTIGNFVIGQ